MFLLKALSRKNSRSSVKVSGQNDARRRGRPKRDKYAFSDTCSRANIYIYIYTYCIEAVSCERRERVCVKEVKSKRSAGRSFKAPLVDFPRLGISLISVLALAHSLSLTLACAYTHTHIYARTYGYTLRSRAVISTAFLSCFVESRSSDR